jgi:hypothetical protein
MKLLSEVAIHGDATTRRDIMPPSPKPTLQFQMTYKLIYRCEIFQPISYLHYAVAITKWREIYTPAAFSAMLSS